MTSPAIANRPRRAPSGTGLARPRAVPPRPAPLRSSRPRPQLRPTFALGLGVAIVFAALLAGAMVHSMLVSGQANLDRVTTETRSQREQLANEQLELARLQAPERIAREAERLGMIHGPDDNWRSPGAPDPTPEATGDAPGGPSVADDPPPTQSGTEVAGPVASREDAQ